MTENTDQLDAIMEQASLALAQMRYLECEVLCLQALGLSRKSGQYSYYARILLPLQEARRQRRLTAAAGAVQLGSGEPGFDPVHWINQRKAGCLLLTHPHTAEHARALTENARKHQRFIEVLFADSDQNENPWMLRSFIGPDVSCVINPPAVGADPAQWFIDASERFGDAAMRDVDASLTGIALIEALESRLAVFTDHELLHQRLAEAARSIR